MADNSSNPPPAVTAAEASAAAGEVARDAESVPGAKEVGGRGGLDPTRYGDWEKNGRCIDF